MCSGTTRPVDVPEELIDALEAVLACWWSDELRDFRAMAGTADPARSDHIFRHLEVIRHWLDDVEEADEDS